MIFDNFRPLATSHCLLFFLRDSGTSGTKR